MSVTPRENPWTDADNISWLLAEQRIDAAIKDHHRRGTTLPIVVDLNGIDVTYAAGQRILDTYGSAASHWSVSLEPGFNGKGPYVKLR